MTELHEATANDDVKTLKCVLVGADIDIDAEDWDWGKRTALHIAASNGKRRLNTIWASTLSKHSRRKEKELVYLSKASSGVS